MAFDRMEGWIPPEERSYEVAKRHDELVSFARLFSSAAPSLADTGKGKIVLLYKALQTVLGRPMSPREQAIGDCVSWGFGHCVDVLSAVEIVLRGEAERYLADCATEWIYGTSRVIQGQGRLRNSDGSVGSWAQAAVKENGTLIRKDYGNGVNLSKYSGERAKDWGFKGLPFDLEKIADEHPVETTALVTSYEEARDSIANGYPIAVCSNVGFTMERDSEGFCRRKGSWAHCMAFTGVDDSSNRPGLLCQNSWGDYLRGGSRHDQPVGSFWVDADVADAMLRQSDSYALSGFKGYPGQVDKLDHRPW
jgi:hypothetical protein